MSTIISPNQKMLDIFRLKVPVQGGAVTKCLLCPVSFAMPESYAWEADARYARQSFQLCRRCYSNLYFRSTDEGSQEIVALIDRNTPSIYRKAEFKTFDCTGQYGVHLGGVRRRVIQWAMEYANGQNQKRSLYLFSKGGQYGSGCGNGKTHLLWAAYRYIARNTSLYLTEDANEIYIRCQVLDIEELVSDFKARKAKCSYDETPSYSIPCGPDSFRLGSFDKYREYLAGRMLLFIDDLGKGYPKGMLVETIEYLVDQRANRGLPTFFTSNYSIDDLDKRLSPRIASRILRNGCDVVELRAPDYWRCRASETSQQERWDGAGDGTPATGERNVPAETNITLTKEAISK